MLQIMIRWARALPSALVLLALTAAAAVAAGPPFPDPETDRAVYDEAGVLRPEVVAELESRIDAVEASTGAEIYVYTQVDPGISEDENLAKAAALMDQWGIGRSGFDDGLVLLVGLNDDRVHGKVSLYGGSGFISQHIDESELTGIIDSDFVPRAQDGDLNAATLDHDRCGPGTDGAGHDPTDGRSRGERGARAHRRTSRPAGHPRRGMVEVAPRGRRSRADRLAVDPDGGPTGRDDPAAGHRRSCRPGKRP
jgi:uncharacterized protein